VKIGDLVRRTVAMPGLDKIYGIITAVQPLVEFPTACEVLWPDGRTTIPYKKNLMVVNESR
jgi:hypothetical protein